MLVRSCTLEDSAAICGIYNHYIENTVITFEEAPLTTDAMRDRIKTGMQLYPWLVCEIDGNVAGYAYASRWKDRSAYKYTAEATIYLHSQKIGKGIGKALYAELIARLKQQNIHTLLACIATPNAASEKLHERMGFNKAAHFTNVGFKFNRWLDIGYWQKSLD